MPDNRDGLATTYSLRSLGTGALQAAAGNHTHGGGGTGDFVGPASSTNTAVVRFDGVTGKLGQDSVLLVSNTGNLTGGTWTGAAVAAIYGGTGQTVYVVGDVLYASTTTALSRLAAGTVGYVLTSGGPGVAPSWAAGGGGNAVVVAVNFGATFTEYAETVVTGQAWVTAGSAIVVTPLASAGESMGTALHGFSAVVLDRVVGVGFTLAVFATVEAKGSFNFSCLGV